MTSRSFAGAVGAFLLIAPLAAWAADTLVVSGGDGTYKPGVAKSWSTESDAVVFVLNDGVDGEKVAATLRERLAQAKITFAGGKLSVRGIPQPALLDQLSGLSLSGDADPLAALAGLGGGVQGNEAPEGGGSIRASKPTPLPDAVATAAAAAADAGAEPGAAERMDGEVLEITRGAFPQVTIKIRVRKAVSAGPLKGKVTSGKIIAAPVVLSGPSGAVDFSQAQNQRNAGAYYLKKGDRVTLHAVEPAEGKLAVDWIERK